MILSDVGDIGVSYEGLELILSPSLYAISKLGEGKEIVEVFTRVMGGDLAYSLAAIQMCADRDISGVFGYIDENLAFQEKGASASEVIIVAQSLMKHGLIGGIERKSEPTDSGSYTKEFDAKEYVAMAVAHLGISIKDAWSMTMTTLLSVLEAKFPNTDKKDTPTLEEVDQTMEWFESVKAAREE